MFSTFRGSPEQRDAQRLGLERVRAWTRQRFSLTDDAPLLVTEVACSLPGCPPLETVVAFWTGADRRHQFKVFKPAAQVTSEDLPFFWMKDALRVPDDFRVYKQTPLADGVLRQWRGVEPRSGAIPDRSILN